MNTSSGRAKAAIVAAIKGLILTPTRELAAQCLGMMTAMAKFTGLRAVLIVGGSKNVNAQVSSTGCKFPQNFLGGKTAASLPWGCNLSYG